MSDKDLRDLLEKLQIEIEQTNLEDEKERGLLHELSSAIQEYLDTSEEGRQIAGENLTKQLQDNVDHFEISHPTLTMLVSEAATILSNAGI